MLAVREDKKLLIYQEESRCLYLKNEVILRVKPSCICVCAEGIIAIGSKCGDILILKINDKEDIEQLTLMKGVHKQQINGLVAVDNQLFVSVSEDKSMVVISYREGIIRERIV